MVLIFFINEVFLRHQGRETTKIKDKMIKILKKGSGEKN